MLSWDACSAAKCWPERGRPARSEQLDVVVRDLGMQMAIAHQVVVVAHAVAAMFLGVVERLVRLAQDFHRSTALRAGETQAHRDAAHLREIVFLHGGAEPVEGLVGGGERRRAQQDHELLPSEAEDAVVPAEGVAQDVGDQDQHLVAVQVPETVVDLLEVVDVHHGQPVLQRLAARLGRIVRLGGYLGRRVAGHAGAPRELLVEGLAVEQAGQRVALAVVQQALVVLVDEEDALDHVELVGRERPRLRDLDAGMHLVVQPHRQPQHVLAAPHGLQHVRPALGDAFVQRRERRQGLAARIDRGFPVAGDHLPVLVPGARPHVGLAARLEDLQRAHRLDGGELVQGGQHRHFQPQVIAMAGHFDQVVEDGLHGCGAGRCEGAGALTVRPCAGKGYPIRRGPGAARGSRTW